MFKDLGADGIIEGGQTMNPSTQDILLQINRTPAEIVFVFPNNKNIIMAAEQCIPLSEKKVVVIPTKNVPQGVSAMLALDTYAEEDECVATLTETAERVHVASVTYAARDSEFDGHSIKAGEYLALLDGALLGSFTELPVLMEVVCDRLKSYDPELISVYYGEDVSEDGAAAVSETISAQIPDAEVSVVSGGQPVYYFWIAAE